MYLQIKKLLYSLKCQDFLNSAFHIMIMPSYLEYLQGNIKSIIYLLIVLVYLSTYS